MIKIFGEGGVGWGGGSSKRCLKWGSGGGVGLLRDLSKKLKQGLGKDKSCS